MVSSPGMVLQNGACPAGGGTEERAHLWFRATDEWNETSASESPQHVSDMKSEPLGPGRLSITI